MPIRNIARVPPRRGQESAWDYPRPPAARRDGRRVQVWFAGEKIADSGRTVRVLETSHPPTFYIPAGDVLVRHLEPSGRHSFCEFKGHAAYYNVRIGERVAGNAAWTFPDPAPGFEVITEHFAFYPSPMERCLVNGETVKPQPGGFYGGWITSDVVGPFKGDRGTEGW